MAGYSLLMKGSDKKNFFVIPLLSGGVFTSIPLIFQWNYRNRLFSIFLFMGMMLLFIGAGGLVIWWLQKLKVEIKQKDYFSLILTIIVIILAVYNSFTK